MPTTIITGSTSGIGLEVAKNLAQKNHDLVLVSRDLTKLEQTKNNILKENNINCEVFQHDLSLVQENILLHKI